jgi:uncharacterized RDD family membrane protein YckC
VSKPRPTKSLPAPPRRPSRAAVKPADVAVGLAVFGARVGVSAARLALVPVKLAAQAPVVGPVLQRTGAALAADGREARERGRTQLEDAAARVLEAPEFERSVDRALAGPLTDAVARSAAEHRIVVRVATQVLRGPDFEDAVARALEDERTRRMVERSLASPGVERMAISAVESRLTAEVTERVLQSPEVRAALTRQTAGFAEELVAALRARLRRFDDALSRALRDRLRRPAAPPGYGGLASRAVGLGVDVALAQLIVLTLVAVGGLVASLVGELRPAWLVGALVAIAWFVVVGGYLVLFWTVAGQTPGMRLLRLRVAGPTGRPPGIGRSLVRLVGLWLSIVPLFAGFLPVPVDGRRRGLLDFLAGTTVQADSAPAPAPAPVLEGQIVADG